MSRQTLSILIPAYNEAPTIHRILNKILAVKLTGDLQKEIIVVNDCSTDGTEKVVEEYIRQHEHDDIKLFSQQVNQGKGAALHKGIEVASGDFIMIQDADLEYDPEEYNILLKPILDSYADVVYGSRFMGGKPHRHPVLLAFHREQAPDTDLKYIYQSEPERYGNMLQAVQIGIHQKDLFQGKTVWL